MSIKKGIVIGSVMLMSLMSCNSGGTSGENIDLQTKRKIIRKQIDSLKKELVKVEKQLRDSIVEEYPEISVDTVKSGEFSYYIDLQGVVKSDGDVLVVPLFQGEVMKIYKKVGDKVRKGDLIMKLDDKILRNQIEEVRTQYRLAQTTYERQKRLWEQKIGSEMNYLQARTKYLSLQKKLRTLNEQLKKARITSPVSGTLDELMVKEGETAMPGRPVARVVNLREVYVEADVSEKYLKDITKGKPVTVKFNEADIEEQARITHTGNFIHPNNRTFKMRIDLDNTSGLLKPNLTAKVHVLSQKIDSAVVIPVALVQEDAQGHAYVFVLDSLQTDEEGRTVYEVKKRPVVRGPVYNKKIWIKDGLQPGDLLALTGAFGLTQGDRVYIKTDNNEQ